MVLKKLAIVIPAYKDTYLKDALGSISKQTNKDFNVYIGDDNSPYKLEQIVQEFREDINIVYRKFENNVGGTDLIAQWNRCINLTEHEEWIWLFSDDDMMGEDCVKAFYEHIAIHKDEELLHFNVDVIDAVSVKYEDSNPFPDFLNSSDFFYKRINYQIHSFVVEYIFKRELYIRKNGFQNFDLAWCADDATWIKFSIDKGISTITGAKVKWRYSGINISSLTGVKETIYRKLNATLEYIAWAELFLSKNNKKDNTLKTSKVKWIFGAVDNITSFKFTEKIRVTIHVLKSLGSKYYLSLPVVSYTLINLIVMELKTFQLKRR